MTDPSFPLYYRDFLHGTRFFTREQRGLYVELLCEQWDSDEGRISDDQMESILTNVDVSVFKPVLDKFKHDNDGYFNARQELERVKRLKHKVKQRENVMKRWAKKNDTTVLPPYNDGNTSVIPLDNDNDNDNNSNTVLTKDDKEKLLIKRKNSFGETLKDFEKEYGRDMLKHFYDYWSEWNKSGTKMRFELERTWELSMRLAYWKKRADDIVFKRDKKPPPQLKGDFE